MNYELAKVKLRLDTNLFEPIRDYYGSVPWLDNPKGEQNPELIVEEWAKALESFSGEELRAAVGYIKKHKKSMTCPTLAHVLEALKQIPKTVIPEEKEDDEPCYTNTADYVRAFVPKGAFYDSWLLNKIFYEAVEKKLPAIIGEQAYREMELAYPGQPWKVRGMMSKKCVELGIFNDLKSFDCVKNRM